MIVDPVETFAKFCFVLFCFFLSNIVLFADWLCSNFEIVGSCVHYVWRKVNADYFEINNGSKVRLVRARSPVKAVVYHMLS